jgi:hypothetical protein
MEIVGVVPAGRSATTLKVTREAGAAFEESAARSAKPSMDELSKRGRSSAALISTPSTRWMQAVRGMVSVLTGLNWERILSRACSTLSKDILLTWFYAMRFHNVGEVLDTGEDTAELVRFLPTTRLRSANVRRVLTETPTMFTLHCPAT